MSRINARPRRSTKPSPTAKQRRQKKSRFVLRRVLLTESEVRCLARGFRIWKKLRHEFYRAVDESCRVSGESRMTRVS